MSIGFDDLTAPAVSDTFKLARSAKVTVTRMGRDAAPRPTMPLRLALARRDGEGRFPAAGRAGCGGLGRGPD